MNLNDTEVQRPRQPEGALPSEPTPTVQHRHDQLVVLDAQEALRCLVQNYTAARVATWLRFIAAQEGQELPETREPAHDRAGAYGEHDQERAR